MSEKRVTIFGFGSQGRTQALNASESGFDVTVFLRSKSPRLDQAKKDGFKIISDPVAAAGQANIAVLLIPDMEQPTFWETVLKDNLPKNASLIFAHGFNIHYQQIIPRKDIDTLLVAPFHQAEELRRNFLNGETNTILTAIHPGASPHAENLAKEYALSIGGKKTAQIASSFKEETETDLFAEQAVLCGGVNALIKAAFTTLVKAGYNRHIAYHCCLKELKAMATCLYLYGISGTREKISDIALFGDLTRGEKIIDENVTATFQKILNEISSGKFKEELLEDKNSGWPTLKRLLEKEAGHPIEKTRKNFEL